MEISTAAHRCLRRICVRPSYCRHFTTNNTTSTSRSLHQQITRVSSRSLSSTSTYRQNTPPQPQPVSQERGIDDTVGTLPPNPSPKDIPIPDPNKRIDLSALSGNPTSNTLPGEGNNNTSTPTLRPSTASARLDALFNRPTGNRPESPFQKAIRQTDALDRTNDPFSSSPTRTNERIDIGAFLEDLQGTRPARPTTAGGGSLANDADAKMPLRLKPTLGRTQPVDNGRGVDLTRAFRMLETKCHANGIKSDLRRQKFHVRRGQRAKLDRSVRWRQAFKVGFLEECARVRRMKNQGW